VGGVVRTVNELLSDLLNEVTAVEGFTQEGEGYFVQDMRTQYAVMMAYARIGEIVKQLPNELLATQAHVEWSDIKGFRDVIIHRYYALSEKRVWMAVEKLAILKKAVEGMIATLSDENES
jgi:uncharacterized protein with HEPN domain